MSEDDDDDDSRAMMNNLAGPRSTGFSIGALGERRRAGTRAGEEDEDFDLIEYDDENRWDPFTVALRLVVIGLCIASATLIIAGVFVEECDELGCTLLAYHPFMMSLGFIMFMTSAILTYIGATDRVFARKLHVLLQCIAFVCMILGLILIIMNKMEQGKDQFQSTHSWLGLIAIVGVILQSMTGVVKYINLPRLTIHSHGLVGLASWVVGMFALMLGVNDYAARRSGLGWEDSLWDQFGYKQFAVLLPSFLIVVILYAWHLEHTRSHLYFGD